MESVVVDLGERSYPIHIGPGLLRRADLLAPHIAGRRLFVVTDETVAPLYLETLRGALEGFEVATAVIPDGESAKTLEQASRLIDRMIDERCDRRTTVIALGGGVVGDLAGFVAACYQRGVPYIQAPTTLLAQVDSSVGGKTGVNHPRGKNMIGAFHQPRCVVADIATLRTLPVREVAAGIAEIVKYGAIGDASFFAWLEGNMERLVALDEEVVIEAVAASCRSKAAVVAADEREGGLRAILNFGHTFGHAIETATGYRTWLHGEAVAAGMVMAADLSARLGWLDAGEADRLRRLLVRAGLPVSPPATMTGDDFIAAMEVDKKVDAGRIRLVLLRGLGNAVISADHGDAPLRETIARALGAGALV